MAILEVRNIEKHFGRTNVLKDVSFSMVHQAQERLLCYGALTSLRDLTVVRLL